MAAETRRPDSPLIPALLREGHRFSFFQAVHLLERYCEDAAPVGFRGPAEKEAIRFRPYEGFEFPKGDITSINEIESEENRRRYLMTITFLGLYGTVSPLPSFYAEQILRECNEDTSVRDFLDVFHHRILSLFYRCWTKYRYHIEFRPTGNDRTSSRMFSLIGLGDQGLRSALRVPAVRLLRYAGLLTQHPRSAEGLRGLLSDYFSAGTVRVIQCTGRWVRIPKDQRSRLGRGNCTIGADCSLGQRVFDRTGGFRIALGPMGIEDFDRFLPGNRDLDALSELVGLYSTDRLDFDVELKLMGEEIPECRISSVEPVMLGWTTWTGRPEGSGYRSVTFRSPSL
ncbi:type VI secretion system baseplate subunit TssG [Thermodesulfobacteriota bacterium]